MRLLAALLVCALTSVAADLSGRWEFMLVGGGVSDADRVDITLKDGLYAFDYGDMNLKGREQGGQVVFDCLEHGIPCGQWKATVTGGTVSGTAMVSGIEMRWTGKRPSPPPASPARHEFTPTVFHREFSAAKEPALHINSGDTVHTTTVDAGGRDEHGKHRVFGGNPLTGPFYIEGALPGDTLAIKFTRIRLNRDIATSGDVVVGPALDPGYFRDLPKVEKFDSEWTLDRARGTAALKSPTERLRNYSVPLRPMLGCVGVAPPGQQAFRAGYLGDWGGNMDYPEVREGTTVFLRVNVPGALLFIGDGHAAQGDGELTGDALETSMEVEFTVTVSQKRGLRQPRFENGEYVMVSGIANSLSQALQRATTGMSQYLERQYKLNPAEVGVVLGTAIRYDVAEVVDPLVHIVAKLPRSALAGLKPEPEQ